LLVWLLTGRLLGGGLLGGGLLGGGLLGGGLLGGGQGASAADIGLEIGRNVILGGELAVTSNYLYHGVSESDDHVAVQADLHADFSGTYVGVWSSTRDDTLDPYADYDVEIYAGHRFALGSEWSAGVDVLSHYFVGGNQDEGSADYQQLRASLGYLDRWTVSIGVIPNAVHYWFDERAGRSLAWFGETAGQYLLLDCGLFATGGAGYYHADGTGTLTRGGGYPYGNVGLAFEHRRWRGDVGYFVAQGTARRLLPYPIPSDRFAGTLSWQF